MPQSSRWVALLSLFTLGSFVETIFFGQLGAFTPLYLPRLGIQAGEVARWTGIIAATSGLLGLPFLPFWGALADRYARKPVILRSFAIEAVAGVIALLAGNIWIFLIGRSVTSLSLGNTGLMMATLSERAPANRQGLAISIMNSAGPIGVFIGPMIGGPVVDRWGLPTLLMIDALLLAIVVAALGLGYRDRFKGTNRGPLLKMAGDSVRILLDSRRLRLLFPALFVLFAGWMLALTYAPLAIAQLYTGQDQATVVGIILGAGGLLALVLSPLLGWLADRFGYWRILFVGAIIEGVLWPLPALAHSLVPFGITWALINGVGAGVFAVSFTVLAHSASEDVRGRVMSFAYLPVNMGLFLGPTIGSLVTRGSVFAVFPTAAILTALGIVLLGFAARR